MSSVSGPSRTRSLRRPTVRGNVETNKNNESAPVRTATRTTSPSRLPIKPLTRSASAKVSSSTTGAARTVAAAAPASRPVSGIFSSRKVSNPPGSTGSTTTTATTTTTAATTTKPRGLARAPSTRQAPPSTTISSSAASSVPTRTASTTTRPRSSGGPPSVTSARERQTGHSRAKSTVTSLTSATTLRPVSTLSGSTSTSASTVTTSTSTPTATTTKPVTRSQTHSRTKSQPYSQSQLPSSPKQNSTTTSAQPPRPAFSTNQQHYSPAKNLAPKPLTSTFLAPPSPSKLPANVAISSETSRLQTELLQLSLLHRDATAVDAEWHASARQKLGARFARLAAADADVTKLEREGVEARNISALLRWGANDSSNPGSSKRRRALDEKVQLLDQVLSGVWSLGEPGGRYQRAVSAFEAWASRASAILAAQRSGDVDALLSGDDVVFLSELDAGRAWKRDCAGLVRALEGWRDTLRDLGDADDEPDAVDAGYSGLARALRGARALVHDMLAELEVMARIEREATAAEEAWIESMNDELKANDTHQKDDVPLWKMLL
ncbi:hypothetical protein F4775DRAFT_531896 [Biscogniauxia sp. FL1348]|nr:hypothetical protein F4775DRAFT_531896 [Biscogniauxia sp. FL1348]